MSLRKNLIKLAHTNPEMREHILPLLKVARERVPVRSRDAIKLAIREGQLADIDEWSLDDTSEPVGAALARVTDYKVRKARFTPRESDCYWEKDHYNTMLVVAGTLEFVFDVEFQADKPSTGTVSVKYKTEYPLDVDAIDGLDYYNPFA